MDRNLKYILASLASVICFVLYVMTLYPSVGFMDSGELATAFATLGVPHPTGYPLSLIIGYIFSMLPFGSVIYRLNLMSAVLSAVSVYITFFVSLNLIQLTSKESPSKTSKKIKQKEVFRLDENAIMIASFFSALCFGLSRTFWSNAIQVEVYALHSLFISVLVYLMLRIYSSRESRPKKLWVVLFIVVGFSFANHMTTIFLLTGLLYLLYVQYKTDTFFTKSILYFVFAVLPGFLLYFVLMYAASSQPFMNWSDPSTFSNLIYHIRGSDYSQMMFSGSNVFSRNLAGFFGGYFNEFSYLFGALAIAGLIRLLKFDKRLFVLFIILILGCLLYSLNYNIRDLQSYFTLIYFLLSLCTGAGLIYLVSFMVKNIKPAVAILIIGLISCGAVLSSNYKVNDNHDNYLVEDLTVKTLNTLEPNSIVFIYEWGYFYPASVYFQQVEKMRGDVKVFNVKFLSVMWYLDNIKKYYPDVYENIKSEIEDYKKFYSPQGNNASSQALAILVKGFFAKNLNKFPVYCTYDLVYSNEIKSLLGGSYQFQPDGLVYRVKGNENGYDSTAGEKALGLNFRKFIPNDKEENKMIGAVSGLYYDNAMYHYQNKNYNLAVRFLDKALEIKNDFVEAMNLKNKILKENLKN